MNFIEFIDQLTQLLTITYVLKSMDSDQSKFFFK